MKKKDNIPNLSSMLLSFFWLAALCTVRLNSFMTGYSCTYAKQKLKGNVTFLKQHLNFKSQDK